MRETVYRSKRISFSVPFALSCIGLFALIHFLPPFVTAPLNAHTAAILGLILNALGVPVSAANDLVSGPGLAFRIIPECTPIFTAGLFLCFVGCYPAAFRDKAKALLLGIPALYLGNLARLVAISLISRYDRRLFDLLHVYLGQVFTLFLVILACLAWMRWLDRKQSTRSPSLKSAVFLVRFAVISGCLFLVWIKLHHGYIGLLDQIIESGFSLFNLQVPLAMNTVYYYETFSTVAFTSLVIAAGSMPLKMRLKGLAGGLGVLFVTHLLHRINNVLLAYFHMNALVPIDLTLLVVGQYLVPVLFLICLLRVQRPFTPTWPATLGWGR
jgi:exosortase H (IPTLxxWG-CTERM-specific)